MEAGEATSEKGRERCEREGGRKGEEGELRTAGKALTKIEGRYRLATSGNATSLLSKDPLYREEGRRVLEEEVTAEVASSVFLAS